MKRVRDGWAPRTFSYPVELLDACRRIKSSRHCARVLGEEPRTDGSIAEIIRAALWIGVRSMMIQIRELEEKSKKGAKDR